MDNSSIMKPNGPQTAVVMGGTSGIGREVALELAHRGWRVAVCGRNEQRLQEMKQAAEGIVACRRIDITSAEAPHQLMELIDFLGGINLYFHSSGVGWQNPGLDPAKELLTVETNAVGFCRMMTAVWHCCVQRTEQPVQLAVISSIAGTKGLGAAPAYSATKRFVNHYMECLEQLRRMQHIRHITLHDIRPGFVRTPLIDDGRSYPMQLDAARVARQIVDALHQGKTIITIDWRYRLLVSLWRCIPRWLWVRLPIH